MIAYILHKAIGQQILISWIKDKKIYNSKYININT